MKRKPQRVEVWFDGPHPVILGRQGWSEPIVEVIERWDVRGRWWTSDTQRHYMVVRTERGTFEVCGDRNTREWVMTAVFD